MRMAAPLGFRESETKAEACRRAGRRRARGHRHRLSRIAASVGARSRLARRRPSAWVTSGWWR